MSNRDVLPEAERLGPIERFEHVVFLGTFNADAYRPQIENWLPQLDLEGVALFVADNHSTDNTVSWIRDVIAKLNCYSEISINESNFGGYGNLAVNLDRFRDAKWVTTLHQDDQYSPKHIQNHRTLISKADANVGMICSEAISITPDGKRVGYPRAHWLLEQNADPVTVFLAHLRNHAYPFSGATFSKNVLLEFPIPWHSTAFPDTEIVMKMSAEYRALFANGVTVKYLENPTSESHSLAPQHRDFGAFQALLRVFAHPNYKKLCELVAKEEFRDFLKSLDEGISQRFHDPLYVHLMKQAAYEITAQHIGTSPELASHLAKGYLRVKDVRALGTLRALGASMPAEFPPGAEAKKLPVSEPSASRSFALAAKVATLVPRSLRRFLFKAFMRSKIGRSMLASWDFDWRRR